MAFRNKTPNAENRADVLAQKQSKLNSYNQQFEKAVSLITDTIENLGAISRGIDETLKEIDAYQNELAATRDGLVEAREKNDRVVENFKALLSA